MAGWEDLEQDKVWLDKPLQSLTDDHLVNLYGWLFRNAYRFQAQLLRDMCYAVLHMNGEMAQDSVDAEIAQLEETDPLLWMEERPFFQALRREIYKRQGYHVCRVMERN